MRLARLLTLPLIVALVATPRLATSQVNINVRFGTRLGPEIGVFAYSQERLGDWHTNYRRWTPVTLYDINGRYYRASVPGARPVMMYTYNGEYFLPPQDAEWVNRDKRYNYGRRPTPVDDGRGRAWTAANRRDPRLGAEIGVLDYSSDRAGAWQQNYRKWTPTTVYEVNGHYYQHNAPGARAVGIYRYKSEYFLPPSDQAWNGRDNRFNNRGTPNADDRGRVRSKP